ncbi:related to myosin heavy chain proteins [Cephalotrichum gorgonifer]|uniref:Ribosome biogenesis protein NOP53 n=1 Tax=Cephalotrichum gorgonifer TaxID=2041049 RepID=A0AAE8SVW6_9PEZI|nr:related to myosin heavy chain proteins [Cephalotrichum gorgonifer]
MPVIGAPSGSSSRPGQHSQPSRKGKKAWRKNVDVSEVEKGLVELNEEIIRGGPVAERDSAELFTLDTVGDANIKKQLPKALRPTLKADEIISQRSKIQAVTPRKRHGDKSTDGVMPTKRVRTNYVTHKELARLRKVADGVHEQTVVVKDATYDVWGAAPEPKPTEEDVNFIPPVVKAKVPTTLREKPISLAANGKEVPAVPMPTGGYSYNPAFAEYEKRLAEEGAKAVAAETQRLAALEEERIRQEAVARSAAEAEAAEARAEMSEWEEDSEWEGFQSGAEDAKPSVKRPERKTKAQRNKIQRRKEEERKAKTAAANKRKHDQLLMVKKFNREEAAKQEELALARAQAESSDSEGDEEVIRRRKFGKAKLPEKELELVLPDELQESLRLLRPEGNLLRDKYRNMLVRGKLESRKHIPFKKQNKGKVTEKWTYKDFTML